MNGAPDFEQALRDERGWKPLAALQPDIRAAVEVRLIPIDPAPNSADYPPSRQGVIVDAPAQTENGCQLSGAYLFQPRECPDTTPAVTNVLPTGIVTEYRSYGTNLQSQFWARLLLG